MSFYRCFTPIFLWVFYTHIFMSVLHPYFYGCFTTIFLWVFYTHIFMGVLHPYFMGVLHPYFMGILHPYFMGVLHPYFISVLHPYFYGCFTPIQLVCVSIAGNQDTFSCSTPSQFWTVSMIPTQLAINRSHIRCGWSQLAVTAASGVAPQPTGCFWAFFTPCCHRIHLMPAIPQLI